MFYPAELLSRRRRGKLAPCWLAAMSSQKVFKKYYNSNAIKRMDVVKTCEEILEVLQDGRSNRFSLYLSSQLMCGITRIHSYQIAYFQKELFEIQQKLDSTPVTKRRNEFDAVKALEFSDIELPPLDEHFLNAQLRTDLHLLPDEDINTGLQQIMQDATCLNFGCLNDEELDFMLKHNEMLSFDPGRELQIPIEEDISERMADIRIIEEIPEKQISQENLNSVVDVSKKNKSKQRLSLTPQKRLSHQIQVETPTKRRRLSFEAAASPVSPVKNVTISALQLPVQEIRKDYSQEIEMNMELEPLDSNYFMINRRSKKNKIIDQEITLSDRQLRKWRQNTNIHCRELDTPLIHRPTPAIDLFKQSSHVPKRWNVRLHNNFVNRITGPFKSANEDIPAQLVQSAEEMRVEETISRLNLPTEALSAFGETDTAIAAKSVDNIENFLPMTNVIHETADVSQVPLPKVVSKIGVEVGAEVAAEVGTEVGAEVDTVTLGEGISMVEHRTNQERTNINNTDESFEDIDILLKRRQRSSEMKSSPVLSTTSIRSSLPALTSSEILALLEVLWANGQEAVKFSELIPTDTYTREDAATAFEILLDLNAKEKLLLRQADYSHSLRIYKKMN